jgi:hypothetical protein
MPGEEAKNTQISDLFVNLQGLTELVKADALLAAQAAALAAEETSELREQIGNGIPTYKILEVTNSN